MADISPRRHRAWDCATGSGQAAIGLAEYFGEVIATDASAAQLDAAPPHPRVHYLCATAERSGLRDHSVDVVTVAQALHWLDLDAFYREVNRVVVRGGLLAVWSYGPVDVDAKLDGLVDELYRKTLGSYWPKERMHVDSGYRDLPFPFVATDSAEFAMSARWTLAELLGYIGTWSAARRYVKANGDAALRSFAAQLGERWGDPAKSREVRWPLVVKAGRVGTIPA